MPPILPPIQIKTANAVIEIDIDFNTLYEKILKHTIIVYETGIHLKSIPYMSEKYKHELNWLNTNKYCKEFWILKKDMYVTIIKEDFSKLSSFKQKFSTILSNSLEAYENALELGDIDEGRYLFSVNCVKEAYEEINDIIDTLEEVK